MKTFQRRSAGGKGLSLQREQKEQDTVPLLDCSAPTVLPDVQRHHSPEQDNDTSAWFSHALSSRRTSTYLPFPSLIAAVDFLARRRLSAKQRQLQLQAVNELAAYFLEVDSFELVVECASPQRCGAGKRRNANGSHARAQAQHGSDLCDKLRSALELDNGAGTPADDLLGPVAPVCGAGANDMPGRAVCSSPMEEPVGCTSGHADAAEASSPNAKTVQSLADRASSPATASTGHDTSRAVGSAAESRGSSSPQLPQGRSRASKGLHAAIGNDLYWAGAAANAEATASGATGCASTASAAPSSAASPSLAAPGTRSTEAPGGSSQDTVPAVANNSPWPSGAHNAAEADADQSLGGTSPAAPDLSSCAGADDNADTAKEMDALQAAAAAAPMPTRPALTPLQQLLQLCDQEVDADALPTMDQLLREHADLRKVTKIGEGSYGEAFRYGRTVFKIVPINGEQEFNGGAQKRADEMMAETLMCRALSRLSDDDTDRANRTNGFVKTHLVAVCRGMYSKDLVKAWKAWDKQHGSENDPVDRLPSHQLYWVIAMADSGRDLERYPLRSYAQVRSVLCQVALALAVGEQELAFEHRDLHWGNVLVRPAAVAATSEGSRRGGGGGAAAAGVEVFRLCGRELRAATHGVVTTIIDFTQSRLTSPDGSIAFCDMRQDPSLFEGEKGHVQFDTYRFMRKLVGDDWAGSHPQTNCLWVSYLAEVLVQGGTVQPALTTSQKRELRDFRRRAALSPSCTRLVEDEPLFRDLVTRS